MSSTQIGGFVLLAVLVFWIVGAYNRLVSLRSAITRSFPPLDAELLRRETLLQQWLTAARPLFGEAAHAVDAVSAAEGQVRAALDAMRPRPVMPREATTLRLAEDTLIAARQRLLAEAASRAQAAKAADGPSDLASQNEALVAAENALVFARRQFNEATLQYNAARRQFPTWVVANLFGFRPAGTL